MSDMDRDHPLVEAEEAIRAIRNLVRATGDPPGLGAAVGVRLRVSSLGAWGLLLSSCRTIADVIRIGPRYYELSENFLQPSLEHSASGTVLVYADDEIPADVREFVVERDLAYNVTSVRALVGEVVPLRLTARLPAPRAAALAGVLLGFDIESQSASNAIHLPHRVLDRRLVSADDDTYQRCLVHCDELVDVIRQRTSVADRVRTVLHQSATPLLSIEQVAQGFHIDARTLRRRLVEEHTSYQALADEVRAHRAIELLQSPGGTIRQTARVLGYASVPGFTRAFRRWTGKTPAAWSRDHPTYSPVRIGQRSVRTR